MIECQVTHNLKRVISLSNTNTKLIPYSCVHFWGHQFDFSNPCKHFLPGDLSFESNFLNQQFPFITSVDIADCSCLQTEIILYIFITISVLCVQMPMIKLQSLEGEVFEIDVEIARQSVTIKTMLEGNQKSFYSVNRPIVFIEK